MKSIKLKLVFLYLALVFIVMLVSGTFMIVSIRNQEIDRTKEELSNFANTVEGDIFRSNLNENDYYERLNQYISTNNMRDITAHILNGQGYNIDPSTGDTVYKTQAVAGAIQGKSTYSQIRWSVDSNSIQTETMEFARPFFDPENSDQVKYIAYIRISLKQMQDRLYEIAMTFVISVVIALVLTSVIGLLFAGTLTEPITVLTRRAKEWAKNGNLHEQIKVRSADEIGQLTQTFNEMAEELSKNIEGITTEKNKMEILLHNMTDGVLAYDGSGSLIHANYSAQEQLGLRNLKQMNFLEMASKLGLDIDSFDAARLANIKDAAINMGDKYINFIFTPYYNSRNEVDGVVIVLQDITRHKKLDDMRKEFVANVSHEIRTPLTTVKSYTETLLDGAIDDRETAVNFLGIIDREADRMGLLVQDLLELSRFDNKQLAMDPASADLNEIIRNSINQVHLLAEKKNITISFDDENLFYEIYADTPRINQVFVNILNNSLKYSAENTHVSIHVERSERFYRVYIKDEGFGIPKDDLRRIFERFYRVDKARSRAMGGTGLGLSIAKEIIDAHGGRISANSEVGKGTTMIIRFDRV